MHSLLILQGTFYKLAEVQQLASSRRKMSVKQFTVLHTLIVSLYNQHRRGPIPGAQYFTTPRDDHKISLCEDIIQCIAHPVLVAPSEMHFA